MGAIKLDGLTDPHGVFNSIKWHLTPVGLRVDGSIESFSAKTARKIWKRDKADILAAANRFNVPVELIGACCLTESNGNPTAYRKEPDGRWSAGLMQTLRSTAQEMVNLYFDKKVKVTRAWLNNKANSYMVGTAYIAHQRSKTVYDPPVVGAAYNSGGVYEQTGENNRWKMRQYPIGTGKHVDRFVKYFNSFFGLWGADGGAPEMSFVHALGGPGAESSKPPIEPPTEPRKDFTMWSLIATVASTFLGGLFPGGKKGTPGTNIFRSILGLFTGTAVGEKSGVLDLSALFGAGTGMASMDWTTIILTVVLALFGNTGIETVIQKMPAADTKEPPASK